MIVECIIGSALLWWEEMSNVGCKSSFVEYG